jgi:hypothetical protein
LVLHIVFGGLEVDDGLKVHLVSLLSNDLERFENLFKIRFRSLFLSLEDLLLSLLVVIGQLLLEVFVEIGHSWFLLF